MYRLVSGNDLTLSHIIIASHLVYTRCNLFLQAAQQTLDGQHSFAQFIYLQCKINMNTKEMILYDKKTPCQLTISPGSLWLRLYGLKLFVQNTMKKKKKAKHRIKTGFPRIKRRKSNVYATKI